MLKKLNEGHPLGFANIHSVRKHKKMKGTLGGKFVPKLPHNAEKNGRGTL